MARVAILGDVHAEYERLEACLTLLGETGFDIAVLSGDVGLDPPWDSPERERRRADHDASVGRVLARVHERLGCPVVFVPGNHDLRDARPAAGAVNVDGASVEVAGLRVVGLGGAGPEGFGFPYEWTEEQAEAALAATLAGTPAGVDIFLSHTPPAGTALDRVFAGRHVGSAAVRRGIESLRPRLFVCGHIHESWGFARLGGVPCINAGALGPPAGQDIAWRLGWDDGPALVEALRRDPGGRVTTRTWDAARDEPA